MVIIVMLVIMAANACSVPTMRAMGEVNEASIKLRKSIERDLSADAVY